jgi:hypothetical protein
MSRACLGLVLLAIAVGCAGRPPESDPVVPIDQVPAKVTDAAQKALPGYTFDPVYKMKIDGKDAYEVRG